MLGPALGRRASGFTFSQARHCWLFQWLGCQGEFSQGGGARAESVPLGRGASLVRGPSPAMTPRGRGWTCTHDRLGNGVGSGFSLPSLSHVFLHIPSSEEPSHLFSQVFFCQRDSPFFGLSEALDDDQLFWFDFPNSSWHPRLPEFRPEVPSRTPLATVSAQRELCRRLLVALSNFSDQHMQMPEARGIPQVSIFTLQPLQLGKANTLVCSVTNLYPPSANISWERNGEPVTRGVSTTEMYPVQVLGFELFSYLEVTPQEGDEYSCVAKTPGGTLGGSAYWVPKDPIASDLLGTVLGGLAFGVGILLVILGIVLMIKSRRPSIAE